MSFVSKLLGGITGANKIKSGYGDSADFLREYYGKAREDLSPYREFGKERLGVYENFLSGPEGRFKAPTMEDVYASPDYNLGLKTIENSAAARGGLMSGNFLRSAQDYAGSIYNREYDRSMRERQNYINELMGQLGIGYGASSIGSQQALQTGNALAGLRTQEAQQLAEADRWPWEMAAYAYGKKG